MPVTSTAIFPQTILSPIVKIAPADTTSLKTIYTAGSNGSVVMGIFATSTDTSSRDLQFVVTISSVDYIIGTVACPANSGNTNAVPILAVFASTQFPNMLTDVNGNENIYLTAGAILKVKSLATVTSAREISVMAQVGDF